MLLSFDFKPAATRAVTIMLLNAVRTLAIFQKQPDPQTFAAGTAIFEEGHSPHHAYGILEGEVDILINGNPVETLQPGELFGIGALIQSVNRPYTAVAKTDCKLAYLDQERFLFAVQETPMFALEIIKVYSGRLLSLERSL